MANPHYLREYWQDKAVLITGASSGLGAAVVRALAPYRVHFGLLSRREQPMQELADSLQHTESKFDIFACDVQDKDAVYKAVNAFHDKAAKIDVSWINSGISVPSSFKHWDWQVVDSCLKTNLYGAMYTAIACLEHMVPRKQGAVVGISSVAGMRGLPTRGIYSMSKISMDYFFDSLAPELKDIQFTTIRPGFVETPIIDKNPNTFWVMKPERAADLMISAVAKGKTTYIYPFRMAILYHLVRFLPSPFYRAGMRKFASLGRKPNLEKSE